jgi:hypothetical protein
MPRLAWSLKPCARASEGRRRRLHEDHPHRSSRRYCACVNRLEQQWPALAQQIATLTIDRQRELALRAASISLKAVGLPVPDGNEEALRMEVERLDQIAWDIQDDEAAEPDAYDQAFRRARAANAFALTRFGDVPSDAIYEALQALGAPAATAFLLDS